MHLRRPLHRIADRHHRGQALVEMAIILPVILLVMLLGLDLGRVFFGWVGLNNASRIGASYAAAHPTAWGSPGSPAQQANYEAQILADASALNCTLPGTLPTPVFPNGTNLGAPARVTLECDFALITPVVAQIIGGTITISAEAVFPIRGGFIGGVPVGNQPPPPSPSGSPTPTPDPSSTPAPTPAVCFAPSFIGDRINPNQALQTKWEQAGFSTTLVITGGGNARVGSQSPLVAGQPGPCDTTIESVGP